MVEMGSYKSVMTINVDRLYYSVKRPTVTVGIKTTVLETLVMPSRHGSVDEH